MKVTLTKDVKGIGCAHETVEAKDGYVINFLIPKKLAVYATTGSVSQANSRQKHSTDQHELTNKLLEQNIASLADARIVITVKANEKGHLYDAVGEPEILKAAHEQAHIELPKDALKLEKPIKEIGTFDIPVASGEVFGKFSITVQAEM